MVWIRLLKASLNKVQYHRLLPPKFLIHMTPNNNMTLNEPSPVLSATSSKDNLRQLLVDCNANQEESFENVPLFVIIGATGCGKTKLSLELAQHFGGEVINADSMQIYTGLDIVTNKASAEEQATVPHHLLSIVSPFQQFTVLDFQKLALQKIREIVARQKVPIIVGGTNYYIESILWNTLVGSADKLPPNEMKIFSAITKNDEEINETDEPLVAVNTVEELLSQPINHRTLQLIESEQLHRLLAQLDPPCAVTLHPRNKRKIIRALQVYQSTGKRFSDILTKQRQAGSRHGGPLRFKNSIILWVDCDKSTLEQRIRDRVDQMITQGLVDELHRFHLQYNQVYLTSTKRKEIDLYTEGIFQAIGLKELHHWLISLNDHEDNDKKLNNKAMAIGITAMKDRSVSYANKQLKWIRRRFLVAKTVRQVPNVYRLDSTDPARWRTDVLQPALRIIEHTLQVLTSDNTSEKNTIWNKVLNPLAANKQLEADKHDNSDRDDSFISGQFVCDLCQVTVSGGKSYQMHLQSKRHRHNEMQRQKEKQSVDTKEVQSDIV